MAEAERVRVGERLPEAAFGRAGPDGPASRSTAEVFGGRRVLLFGIPGAFTPVCQGNHLPGYVERLAAFRARGVDAIACVSVNDAFVMRAFAREAGAEGAIEMLADPEAAFTAAIGMVADASAFGLGRRSERYAMLVEDGRVALLRVEESFVDHAASSAEEMLAALG